MGGDINVPVEDSSMQMYVGSQQQDSEPSTGEKIEVERGRFSSLRLYEVAEHELILIEKGSDASLWLNFAIASVSIFFSILAALITLDYTNHPNAFVIFVVITVVTAFSTILCGSFWYKTRKTQRDIFNTIRMRFKGSC